METFKNTNRKTSSFIYERNFEEKQMLVVLNFSEERAKFTMPEEWKGKKTELLITNYPGEKELKNRELEPYEAIVWLAL